MHKFAESFFSDEDAAIVENPSGRGGLILICEHAGQLLPKSLGWLGIDEDQMSKHIGWDIGAADLSRAISKILDVPLIMQRYSRLVFDCNRALEASDAIVENSDNIHIPANFFLDETQRQERYQKVYLPFEAAIVKQIDDYLVDSMNPAIVTIHSFTPLFKGQKRSLDLGVLHDVDSSLADQILALSAADTKYTARRNEPYAPRDGVTHTLEFHAIKRGLKNVMLEIRNDLLLDDAGIKIWAQRIAELLSSALQLEQKLH